MTPKEYLKEAGRSRVDYVCGKAGITLDVFKEIASKGIQIVFPDRKTQEEKAKLMQSASVFKKGDEVYRMPICQILRPTDI